MKKFLIFYALSWSLISCQKQKDQILNNTQGSINIDGKEYSLEYLLERVSESTGFHKDSLYFNHETQLFYLNGYDLELDPKHYVYTK